MPRLRIPLFKRVLKDSWSTQWLVSSLGPVHAAASSSFSGALITFGYLLLLNLYLPCPWLWKSLHIQGLSSKTKKVRWKNKWKGRWGWGGWGGCLLWWLSSSELRSDKNYIQFDLSTVWMRKCLSKLSGFQVKVQITTFWLKKEKS